ncbi:MAG: hypothetical protein WCJ74_02245 [bacterium]
MNKTEILERLFGSSAKVKIIKLFLFNQREIFDKDTISDRTKSSSAKVRSELLGLEKINLVKRRTFFKEFEKRGKTVKRRVDGWYVNPDFSLLSALQQLLIKTAPFSYNEIIAKLSKAGRLKFVVITGVFIQDFDSRIDILVVGDSISKAKLETAIKSMEAEIGRELRYCCFETADFKYRVDMYDKLVRDILDFNHEVVLDKMSITA